MKAIILAAGASKRLRPLTDGIPKCLIRIGKKPILAYQLDAVDAAGIKEAVIVVGYLKHMIQEHVGNSYRNISSITYIENPDYDTTNTIYSLYLAGDAFRGHDFIYFNADVLMHADIVRGLVRHEGGNVLAVDYVSCGEEEVKFVTNTDNRIIKLGKYISNEEAEGEFIGVAKFGQGITEPFIDRLKHYSEEGQRNLFFEKAVEDVLIEDTFYPLDVSHIPSIEIDYPEDLEKAKNTIYPEMMRYGVFSDAVQSKIAQRGFKPQPNIKNKLALHPIKDFYNRHSLRSCTTGTSPKGTSSLRSVAVGRTTGTSFDRARYKSNSGIAYYLDASIHQIPSIVYIAYETGGTIYTESELTFQIIRREHPSLDVQLCGTVAEIGAKLAAAGIRVIVHSDFSYKFFKKLPGLKHVQVFHGTSDKKYDYMKFVADYDLFFISGNDAYERYKKKGLLKKGTGILIGYPKLDRVFRSELQRDEELRRLGLDPGYKTVLYAPTWTDKELNSSWKRFRGVLVEKKPDDINFIVKLHPNLTRYRAEEVDRFRTVLESRNRTLLLDKVPDIVPVMAASDLLLGDISSVTREYLAFRRPLIFLSTKPRWLWNKKKTKLWDCGRVVGEPDEVWELVYDVLQKPNEYEHQINSHLQNTFYKPDGRAALRAKEAIYRLLHEGA